MWPESKSPGVVVSGLRLCMASTLMACAALASATNREEPVASAPKGLSTVTWTPDNGNGTFTNPLDSAVTLAAGQSGPAQNFQWIETPTGELALMSLATNRFLRIDPQTKEIRADSPGPIPDDSDGARFVWAE